MKTKLILILIFVISFFLRIYKINETPPLLWDEAALGYNAYSILETGKDEYGKQFPLIFKSFGDYKPGFYVYLSLPFVKIFGLNEISVRLPSIILGSLIPILLYFLIINLDKNKHKLALIAAWISCFNPYNIHYSRGAWETNIITFQIILLFLLFFKRKYILSGIVLGLSLYTYQSGKMLGLLSILILWIIAKNNIFKAKFIIPIFLLAIPIAYGLFFSQDANRLKVVSLFSYPRSHEETQLIIKESNPLDYQIFHNKIIFFTRNFLQRYFNHFSPEFLAIKGDWQNARHSAPYVGVILFPSLIFLIIGLFKANYKKSINLFFLLILILAPIPAALTRDTVQATRSMWMSIGLVYFIALGINIFLKRFSHLLIYFLLITIYLFSFIYYSDLYLNHMVKTNPSHFLYGYKEITKYLIENKDKYQNVYMTNYYKQPYIYYLFYSKYPPALYQKYSHLDSKSLDIGNIEKIDKIIFETPNLAEIKEKPNTLAIFSYNEIMNQLLDPTSFKQIGNFYIYEKP
jgi:4-amino-4-deoxy-L-arabinose transferase-like glycosyltransferase